MANTYRIYYIGSGSTIEASEDGGATWQKYTKCKTVDYGGETYVWAPPGKKFEWKQLSVRVPGLFLNGDPARPLVQHRRSIPVVVEGEGELDSWLDLDANEARACLRESDRVGLVMEKDYKRTLTPDALKQRAAKLLEEAAALEGSNKPSKASKAQYRSKD